MDTDRETIREVLKRSWTALPFVGLVWLLVAGYSPQYVATAMTLFLIVASWVFGRSRYRIGPARFVAIIWEAVTNMAPLIVAVIAAGAIIGSLDLTGLVGKSSILIGIVAGDNVVVSMLVVTVILLILGMGMPTVAVYLLGVALVAPLLIGKFNLEIFSVHLFILYYASISAITPPLAVACFAASAVAGVNVGIRVGLLSCKIAIAGFILPWFFVFHDGILSRGGLVKITGDILTFGVCIYCVSVMLWGHFGWRRSDYLERSLMGGAAVLLTSNALDYSAYGLAIMVLTMAFGGYPGRLFGRRSAIRVPRNIE